MEHILKIVQQNIDQHNHDMEGLSQKLLEQNADVIFLAEYIDDAHHELWERLERAGYSIRCRPKENEEKGWESWLICIVAVKDGVSLTLRVRSDMPLEYRYIEGRVTKDGQGVETLFLHVARGNRPLYKEGMLRAAEAFLKEYTKENAWLGGDFNTELEGGSTTMEPLMRCIYQKGVDTTQPRHAPTWRKKCLDYALVTRSLGESTTIPLPTSSDHVALVTTIILG